MELELVLVLLGLELELELTLLGLARKPPNTILDESGVHAARKAGLAKSGSARNDGIVRKRWPSAL